MSYLDALQRKSKEELVNDAYNDRVAFWADQAEEKLIPYIGWFWRRTDFINKCISIGDCGAFVGVMENNKWGYPERLMTEQEVDTFIAYLERAFDELSKGGIMAEIEANAKKVFKELWDWFQTLTIE